jgi:hypothetical protein
MKRCKIICAALLCVSGLLHSQEALKSVEEEYYDFLALQGLAERPTLNYRTLSDSVWTVPAGTEHIWQDQNLGLPRYFFDGKLKLKIYGPELFNSVNTAAPYGQNDGALWQGRGYNASLTGGVRLEAFGIEATFKPQLAFSQNMAFDIMKGEMSGPNYSGKGDTYGYFWNTVDAPQRFGNEPFFTWDWGDSEIRYTWKTLTVGFGTQSIWLGPAYLNPILHSNNAPTYPKFDIGLRKQPITIPWVNWYVGDIEARIWVGYLSESDYFDNDDSNDHNMFHGLSFAYAPSILPGLTLFVNRVCLVPWEWQNLKYFWPAKTYTIEDQKASFGASWIFPAVGFEIYGEMAIDDYVSGKVLGYIRHPFHSTVYTAGLKKTLKISRQKKMFGEILFEFNWTEMTQDFQFEWPYGFYFHHIIKQGYTNRGQWLGSGIGAAGNSQYLAFKLYYPKGHSLLFVSRNNPDNNYLYKEAVYASAENKELARNNSNSNKANFLIGLHSGYYLTSSFLLSGGLTYDLIINPFYGPTKAGEILTLVHNLSFQLALKWSF